jgi:uncharacterized delta-60 repeat protein
MKTTIVRLLMVLTLAMGALLPKLGSAQLPLPLAQPNLDLRQLASGRKAVALPDGGALIAHNGRFVGGPTERPWLFRMRPDGSVDDTWIVTPSSSVSDIAVVGDDVYIAGSFASVNGQPRRGLARVSLSTGTLSDWNPNSGSTAFFVFSSLALVGDALYVGGNFTQIGTTPRTHLARIDRLTGAIDAAFNPSVTSTDGTPVRTLASDGTALFLGGRFSAINGVSRSNAAKVGLTDGAVVVEWAPTFDFALSEIVLDGGWVYTVGFFGQVSGVSRNRVARLSAAGTGALDGTWNPAPNTSWVRGVAVSSSHVYLSGFFTQVNGQPAFGVARVAKTGPGTLDAAWAPSLEGVGQSGVDAQPLASGSVIIMGDFLTVQGSYSPGLSRVNDSTGALMLPAIYSEQRGLVAALAPAPDGGTYVGGYFHRIGNLEFRGLLRLTPSGALDLAWNPAAGFDGAFVQALAVDGSHVYVAGSQRARLGTATPRFLTRVSHSGSIDNTWNPDPLQDVSAIIVDEATNSLLVGGFFTSIGGQARNSIAEISRSTGQATSFNPNANGVVRAIAQTGTDVFLGGDFTTVGGQPRARLAKVSRGSGAVDPGFVADANNAVRALLPGPSGTLYVGGDFSSISGLGRTGLARLLTSTGAPDPSWNTFPNSSVLALSAAADGIYAGGFFTTIGGQARSSVARLSHTGVVAPLFAPQGVDNVYVVREQSSRVLVGGFLGYFAPASQTQVGIRAYPLNATPVVPTLTITSDLPENTQPHQFYRVEVNAVGAGIPLASQIVTVDCDSGAFCEVFLDAEGNGSCEIASRTPGTRTLTARYAGSSFFLPVTDTETHTVAGIVATPPANPAFDLRSPGFVSGSSAGTNLVRTSDGKVLVAGFFNRIGSEQRRGLVRLLPDGNADPAFRADVLPNGSIGALARDATDHVYAVGSFSHINGVFRSRLAKLDPAGNVVPGWMPARTDVDTSVAFVDAAGDLIVRGFNSGSGSPTVWQTSLLKFSGANGEQRFDLNVTVTRSPNTPVVRVTGDGTHLYVFGQFDAVNGVPRRNLARLSLTGVVDAGWNPSPNLNVLDVDPDGAGGIYVSGEFTEIAGQTAQIRLVRLDPSGGVVSGFNPTPNSFVDNVVIDGGSLYVGGGFSSIGGLPRLLQAKLDASTGAGDSAFQEAISGIRFARLGNALWTPVFSFAVGPTDVNWMGVVRRDATTGALLPTATMTRPAQVFALARQPDGATLIGGSFARLGSTQRNLVRITPGGFYDTAFSPALQDNRTVNALAVHSNGEIFVGDSFGLRKLAANGTIDPGFATPNGTVLALADAGDGLIAGGSFTQVGSPQLTRNRIAKLDYATGVALPGWDPNANGTVRAMAIGPDASIYLGGDFSTVSGQTRARLAKLGADGSLNASWQPQASSTVRALLVDGTDVYAGGFFTTINSVARRGLAKLGAVDGALANWAPAGATSSSFIYALARAQDGGILAGGSFRSLGGAFRSNAAKIDPLTGLADPLWNPSLDGPVFAILAGYGNTPARFRLPHVEQNIAIGGEFEFQGPAPMPGFVAVPSVGQPTTNGVFCDSFESLVCVPQP